MLFPLQPCFKVHLRCLRRAYDCNAMRARKYPMSGYGLVDMDTWWRGYWMGEMFSFYILTGQTGQCMITNNVELLVFKCT